MDVPRPTRVSLGRIAGSLAGIVGVGVGLYLLFGPSGRYEYEEILSDGSHASETGTTSGIEYLFGAEHADPALFYWSLVIVGLSLAGGYGAWTGNRFVVWAVALPLLGLSLLSMAIGLLVAPSAVLFLASGVLLSLAQRADAP